MPPNRAVLSLLTALAALAGSRGARAAVIDEVISGVGGDPAVQYVEMRMLASGEAAVAGSQLAAFSCDGSVATVLVQAASDLTNDGTGVRWIMASPGATAFLAASGIVPDFTWDALAVGGIPPDCGQVCWGLPTDPADAMDAGWADCVAYGPYTGERPPLASAPAGETPGGAPFSLRRVDDVAYGNHFAYDCPSPTNNAGEAGSFAPCTPPSSGPSVCTSRKLEAAGRLLAGRARCEGRDVSRGAPRLPSCLLREEARFTSNVQVAESVPDCLAGTGDEPSIAALVDAFVDELRTTLQPGSARSLCAGKKLVAAGRRAQARAACDAAALARGVPVARSCLTSAQARLLTAFVRASRRPGCPAGSPDATAVAASIDAFVGDLRARLGAIGCGQRVQFVPCAGGEQALRAAVAAANACAAQNPAVDCADLAAFQRTIRFSGAPCTIDIANNQQSANGVATCPDETQDTFRYAICLTDESHHVTIDGGGDVTFSYEDPAVAVPCHDGCNSCGPALFVMKGRCNTVRNFTMQFFPEGVHVREGDGHTVDNLASSFYCDDAVTVDGDSSAGLAPTNALVRGCDFTGSTSSPRCTGAAIGQCGADKAIQVNGGTSVITDNRFTDSGQPVHVAGGSHVIADNVATGSSGDQNVCQGYSVSGGTASFVRNTIDFCKFGIRLVGGSVAPPIVDAFCNVITNGWVSAFQVKRNRVDDVGPAYLRAERNMLRRNGHQSDGDCQKAALVVKDNPDAEVDFGGGGPSGEPLAGFTAPSAGLNRVCGQDVLSDVWNVDTCSGFSGAAYVRAENNCFDPGPPAIAPAPEAADADPYADCTAAECTTFSFADCGP